MEKGDFKMTSSTKKLLEELKGKIVKCECGYIGFRWNNNLTCKRCGGLMKIIGIEKEITGIFDDAMREEGK